MWCRSTRQRRAANRRRRQEFLGSYNAWFNATYSAGFRSYNAWFNAVVPDGQFRMDGLTTTFLRPSWSLLYAQMLVPETKP